MSRGNILSHDYFVKGSQFYRSLSLVAVMIREHWISPAHGSGPDEGGKAMRHHL